jgi:hypothetical protein
MSCVSPGSKRKLTLGNYHWSIERGRVVQSNSGPIFYAASLPRFVRTARLPWLRLEAVIGYWALENANDLNHVYDVIMGRPYEFAHIRHHLSLPWMTVPALQRGGIMGGYILQNVRAVTVPAATPHPERYAAAHFVRIFGLDINRTIFAKDVTVAASPARRQPVKANIDVRNAVCVTPGIATSPPAATRKSRNINMLRTIHADAIDTDDMLQKTGTE